MSSKQLERIRDESLAARVKRAMGGVPTLTLTLQTETEEPRAQRTREAILADVARVYGRAV